MHTGKKFSCWDTWRGKSHSKKANGFYFFCKLQQNVLEGVFTIMQGTGNYKEEERCKIGFTFWECRSQIPALYFILFVGFSTSVVISYFIELLMFWIFKRCKLNAVWLYTEKLKKKLANPRMAYLYCGNSFLHYYKTTVVLCAIDHHISQDKTFCLVSTRNGMTLFSPSPLNGNCLVGQSVSSRKSWRRRKEWSP